MKVIEKYQNSNLNNSDVKWYLFDGVLWITKYNDYFQIEESIPQSVGSFNFLYEGNDTVLFNKEGRFETAVIDHVQLSGIKTDTLKKYADIIGTGKKGDLFLAESYCQNKKYFDFEFLLPIVYDKDEDILLSFPTEFDNQKDSAILITDDFGFVIIDHQLKGWFLKKASEHIYITQENKKEITPYVIPHMIGRYLNAVQLWDENDDVTELESLLEESKIREDEFCIVLGEHIRELLS